jgi:hypothetical protein
VNCLDCYICNSLDCLYMHSVFDTYHNLELRKDPNLIPRTVMYKSITSRFMKTITTYVYWGGQYIEVVMRLCTVCQLTEYWMCRVKGICKGELVYVDWLYSALLMNLVMFLFLYRGTLWRSCLRHCATSGKVPCSIPDGVIGIFLWHNPSGCTMAPGLTQSLTEISTRNISWE